MRSFGLATLAALALCAKALPAPATVPVTDPNGEALANSYIVQFQDGTSKSEQLSQITNSLGPGSFVTDPDWDPSVFNGFAGIFKSDALHMLQTNPSVKSIVANTIVRVSGLSTQSNAPWGLSRLSQKARLTRNDETALNYKYKYDSAAGAGVNIYVIDTGINIGHVDFGGRAVWGTTFGGYANKDGHGHGTHCAGIAGGMQHGMAKKSSLFAVKVLSDDGSGYISDVISGINYVVQQSRITKKPTVASMSLGGSANDALDTAVNNAVAAGVHVAVAAGNDNADASTSSPARAANAVTVGATAIDDSRASFSNYGGLLDIFAPGVSITSTWIGSNTATAILSGTSMATPHVAGLIATLIPTQTNKSPAAIQALLHNYGPDGLLTGLPPGTRNEMANNGNVAN